MHGLVLEISIRLLVGSTRYIQTRQDFLHRCCCFCLWTPGLRARRVALRTSERGRPGVGVLWARKGFTERTEATVCSFPKPDQVRVVPSSFLWFVRLPPFSFSPPFLCHAAGGKGAELVTTPERTPWIGKSRNANCVL